jgi:hypothetical protein
MKGFTELAIGGKKRPVKFGINQTELFCKLRGIGAGEYFGFLKDRFVGAKGDGGEFRDLLWSALKDGARVQGLEFEYDSKAVGDWMDGMKQADFKPMMDAFYDSLPIPDESKKKLKKTI